MVGEITGKIRVEDAPTKTRNRFGPLSAIAGKELDVLERNDYGDCLCFDPTRSHLIDVDAADVVPGSWQPVASRMDNVDLMGVVASAAAVLDAAKKRRSG